ncbi:MAG: hypothetical protein AB7V46_24465 [Thermomicrobiales bacterium]
MSAPPKTAALSTASRTSPEIERELRIWLAMPGFSLAWHANAFGLGKAYIRPHLGGSHQWHDEIVENWLSATREDCAALSRMRPGLGNVPLISQIRAVEDLKHMRAVDVAREYRINYNTIWGWRTRGFQPGRDLPPGFELLVSRI